MKLPYYFALKIDKNNPLSIQYIDWLNKRYGVNFSREVEYYDGKYLGWSGISHGSYMSESSIERFSSENARRPWNAPVNVVEITLDEWCEIRNPGRLDLKEKAEADYRVTPTSVLNYIKYLENRKM